MDSPPSGQTAKPLTISTAGSNHAPTLAIISTGGGGSPTDDTTQLLAAFDSNTVPWDLPLSAVGAFDYSVATNLSSGYTGTSPRAAFGECMQGSSGATDLAPDAQFALTPTTDLNDVTFSVGGTLVVPTDDADANVAPWLSLGTALGQTIEYNGTTSASTTKKWTSNSLGSASCRRTKENRNYEHVFEVVLTAPAALEFRLAASGAYDPVLSLFGGPTMTDPIVGNTIPLPLPCSHTLSGDDVIPRATYAAGTYFLMVHAYDGTANAEAISTGTYSLTVKEGTDEAIVLYDTAPSTPSPLPILGPQGANSNDDFYQFSVGEIDGEFLLLNAGDTRAPQIHADFVPSSFREAQGTCSAVSGFSNDAVIDFSVDTTRKVRIETFDGTGLHPTQSAGFNHVVAVVERPAQLAVAPVRVTNNDKTQSARVFASSSVPSVVGGHTKFTGATYANTNTVTMSESISPEVMYNVANPDTWECSSISRDLQDVVYRFDVSAADAGTYDFDTAGSQSTTYLSLHRSQPDTLRTVDPSVTTRAFPVTNDGVASSSPVGPQTGVALGAIDGKTISYAGTTDGGTSNKWLDAQFAGCRVSPADDAAHENMLSFSLTSTRTVTITLAQTAPYDASVALFSAAPVSAVAQTNRVQLGPDPAKASQIQRVCGEYEGIPCFVGTPEGG